MRIGSAGGQGQRGRVALVEGRCKRVGAVGLKVRRWRRVGGWGKESKVWEQVRLPVERYKKGAISIESIF